MYEFGIRVIVCGIFGWLVLIGRGLCMLVFRIIYGSVWCVIGRVFNIYGCEYGVVGELRCFLVF